MKINLFIDMDGTIAKFYENPQYLEKMYEKDFFRNLKPYKILTTLKELAKEDNNINMFILSACIDSPYCLPEKQAWIDTHFPEIKRGNRIFLKVGESKIKKISQYWKLDTLCVLLDDYSVNLIEWEKYADCVPFKFDNGINNKNKRFYHTIKNGRQLIEHLKEIGYKNE